MNRVGDKLILWACIAICAFVAPASVSATELADNGLFGQQASVHLDPIDIELSGPIGTLIKHSDRDRQQYPFLLKTSERTHKIKVKARGKSRLKVCDFPPLRLNFSKKDSKDSLFANQDKMKLVTKCAKTRRNDKETLFEYAAYKIFALITNISYGVRTVQLSFIDSDQRLNPAMQQQWGFLIESDKGLEKRLGLKSVARAGVSLAKLNKTHMAEVYLFQYLIGNTDWSLVTPDDADKCCHNGDIFNSDTNDFYLPYDFDMTGLVSTKYARPDPSLRIRKVTQRQYRGFCLPDEFLLTAIHKINTLKPAIYELLNKLPSVTDKELKPKTKFLDKYFDESENPEKLLKSLQKNCLR